MRGKADLSRIINGQVICRHKLCPTCGKKFFKSTHIAWSDWAERIYCKGTCRPGQSIDRTRYYAEVNRKMKGSDIEAEFLLSMLRANLAPFHDKGKTLSREEISKLYPGVAISKG